MKAVEEELGPFPFVPNMIECHGFDAVIGGMSRMASVPCKKMAGPCTIWTCRKAMPVEKTKAMEPAAPVVQAIPPIGKWPGLFD